MAEYASTAVERGLEVIIAGAGGAAHLPGMVAAQTVLPVIGVPVQSAALNGLDSLLSIVQMPKGVPVATVAIGPSGAANAGLLAVAILATSRPDLRAKLQAYRDEIAADVRATRSVTAVDTPGSTIGVLGGGQLGRMFAMAARRLGYRVHTLAPEHDTPTGQIADVEINASYDDLDAVRAFAQRVSTSSPSSSRTSRPRPSAEAGAARDRPPERPRADDRAAPHSREDVSRRTRAAGRAVRARFASDDGSRRRRAKVGLPGGAEDGGVRLRRQGPGRDRSRETDLAAAWDALGRREAVLEASSISNARSRSSARAASTATWSHFGPIENAHRRHILDVSVAPADVPPTLGRCWRSTITRPVMEALDYIGILCVEFFVDARRPACWSTSWRRDRTTPDT